MSKVKEGDRVRIVSRSATDDDAKAYTYFSYYGGLTGTVSKVYNQDEVSVEIEPESLTKEIRKRHEDVRDQMKTKWLDGLSEEGRSKLTEREKDFNLRFMVLVKMNDLERAGARPAPAARPAHTEAVDPTQESARKTLADLEAAEEEELRKRRSG